MSSKLITAEIIGPQIKFSTKGNSKGVSIACKHDDGSEYGKRIYQWLWWSEESYDNNITKWAQLSSPECEGGPSAKALVLSHALCGIEIDLIVDTSNDRFWDIEKVGKRGTLSIAVTPTVPDDDIPF